jgi:CheY-like chemotaxis protein
MHSARKAAEVSSLMLTYLGQKQCKLEMLDLSDACHQSLPMLRAAIPKDVVLDVYLPTPGPSIQANASQIQQVLTHLATNAWESSGGGQSVIRLAVKKVSSADIPTVNRFPIDYKIQDSDYACPEVSDTGSGIPLQDIQKLFEPFFSSKFTGRGLGLPVVLGIVRAHHGVVTVESKPGCGSVFRVFLPLLVEAVSQKPVPVAQAPKLAGGGTVLVVDDETSVREVLKTVIEVIGFTVLDAKDGVEAVEVFRQHQDEIRLVLCDLTMPRMDGWETLAALRKLAPDIPVILSSGYSEAHVMEGNHPELPQAFLSKPCRLVELREAFALVLNRVDR